MLRGNLSTRPFYNEGLVTLALGLLAVVALALAAFNATQLWSLSAERSALREQIDANNAQAAGIQSGADAIQRGIDRAALDALLQSTQEANSLIDQRTFSWTGFFDYIENTLPIDVRLVSVQPRVERGEIVIGMLVVTRELRHLQTFVDNLGDTAFRQVFVTGQQQNDDGTFSATVETLYAAPAGPGAGARVGRGGQP